MIKKRYKYIVLGIVFCIFCFIVIFSNAKKMQWVNMVEEKYEQHQEKTPKQTQETYQDFSMRYILLWFPLLEQDEQRDKKLSKQEREIQKELIKGYKKYLKTNQKDYNNQDVNIQGVDYLYSLIEKTS